jgi:hypothetical protein
MGACIIDPWKRCQLSAESIEPVRAAESFHAVRLEPFFYKLSVHLGYWRLDCSVGLMAQLRLHLNREPTPEQEYCSFLAVIVSLALGLAW